MNSNFWSCTGLKRYFYFSFFKYLKVKFSIEFLIALLRKPMPLRELRLCGVGRVYEIIPPSLLPEHSVK